LSSQTKRLKKLVFTVFFA